jgi:CheY-like chemotaxis protein
VLDLNAIVANLAPILHALMRENIDLVLAPAPDLGYVQVDPTQMEQVIIHLAVNARDAMPSRGRLTLTTANVERDDVYALEHLGMTPGRYVLLSISDTGSGMDAETQAHIFEPFFTTKGVGEGTGLGLSIVYGIVTESGGSINVDSTPGRGTTFTIYLPRVDEAVALDRPHPSYTRLPQGQETILVVEAVAAIRHALRHMLHMLGYTVLAASDGGAALQVCAQHEGPIHLLLTDVVLPGMSGRSMADHLASLRPAMKALYMAGSTHDTMAHHGVVEAGTALLQKPFSLDTLAWKVREVLDAHS